LKPILTVQKRIVRWRAGVSIAYEGYKEGDVINDHDIALG